LFGAGIRNTIIVQVNATGLNSATRFSLQRNNLALGQQIGDRHLFPLKLPAGHLPEGTSAKISTTAKEIRYSGLTPFFCNRLTCQNESRNLRHQKSVTLVTDTRSQAIYHLPRYREKRQTDVHCRASKQ
jgi:hypothetical protein